MAVVRTVFMVLVLVFSSLAVTADEIEDFFAARGPFATVDVENVGSDGNFTLFTPESPGMNGMKHPVITWGNGTLSSPDDYFELLDHLASHGYVVIASNSGFVGSGTQMIAGVDWVLEQNENPNSLLFDAIDIDQVGATGHSQGGGGTINAGNDPRISCLAPLQGTPGNTEGIQGPLFSMGGGRDNIVPWEGIAETHYVPSLVPTIFAVLGDAGHFEPLDDAGRYRGYLTAWFAACLMGDDFAAEAFGKECSLCENEEWRVIRKSGE